MKRRATCHPNSVHVAKGLCDTCYRREWRGKNRVKFRARPSQQKAAINNKSQKYRDKHRERVRQTANEWRRANKHVSRDYWLRSNYGLTLEEFEMLLTDQGGVCAVCHKPETRSRNGSVLALVVDHNHRTGQVRGLLCHACNVSIGLLAENPDRMRAAAVYVEHYERLAPE